MSDHAATPLTIFVRRYAHSVAGFVTTLWVLFIGVLTFALLEPGFHFPPSSPYRALIGGLFLASIALYAVAFLIARAIAPALFDARLDAAALARTRTPDAPPESVLRTMERVAIAKSIERRGTAWPMIALAFVYPLTLHYIIASSALVFFRHQWPLGLSELGQWIGWSVYLVTQAHLVLAGSAWLIAKRLHDTPTSVLDTTARFGGAKAWLATTLSGLFSIALTPGTPWVLGVAVAALVGLTGLPFIVFFRRSRKKLIEDRKALDRALLGNEEQLVELAGWRAGPEELRLLALDAINESGQRIRARVLIDQLQPDELPRVRQKLLALSIDLFHRPKLELLTKIVEDERDVVSMALACRLIEHHRDRRAETPLLRALVLQAHDPLTIAAANALARCGSIASIEALRSVALTMMQRRPVSTACFNAIDTIQAHIDPARAHGELSLVAADARGAVSFSHEDGALSVTSDA